MENATRDIRELMLRISREDEEAEMVDAQLAAGAVDAETFIEQMRALLERIQEATLRISEELDDLQEGRSDVVR